MSFAEIIKLIVSFLNIKKNEKRTVTVYSSDNNKIDEDGGPYIVEIEESDKVKKNDGDKMLTEFNDIIEVVLHHEGGYVNDPKDPGGETNFGIAKRSHPDVDIKNLTKEGATEIYKRDYWDKNKVDSLPDELKHIAFDMYVNMGKSRGVKIIQKASNAKGANLKVDGGMGPKTLAAVKESGVELERVRAYRVKYYADLVTRKPDLEKFYFGWYRRALEV